MEPPATSRYCPACHLVTPEATCPTDGRATVPRVRLDADDRALKAGDVVEGRYVITGFVGRGGFGMVFAAEHLGTHQPVALKMLLPDPQGLDGAEIARFLREARITARLRHANTVRVFDVGQTASGAPYIAMELLRGPTLEQALRQRAASQGVLSEAEALDIAVAVARSLSEAHNQGLVHRDLKPANVLLTEVDGEQVVKVLDFGIARGAGGTQTDTGRGLGTPAYMSPEQCRGEPLDARSDLYALGVMLYRCVTGQLPFEASSALGLLHKHATEPPPDLRSAARTPLSDGFVALVLQLLAKAPDERPASARDLALAFEQVKLGRPGLLPLPPQEDLTVRELPQGASPPVPRVRLQVPSRLPYVGMAVLALTAAWLGGMVLGGRASGTPPVAVVAAGPASQAVRATLAPAQATAPSPSLGAPPPVRRENLPASAAEGPLAASPPSGQAVPAPAPATATQAPAEAPRPPRRARKPAAQAVPRFERYAPE